MDVQMQAYWQCASMVINQECDELGYIGSVIWNNKNNC